jgi:hypothetical protein
MPKKNKHKPLVAGFTPLAWYLGITVIIPLLSHGVWNIKKNLYHFLTVLAVSILLLTFFYIARKSLRFLLKKITKLF